MTAIRVPLRATGAALACSGVAWAAATPLHPSIFGGDVAGVVLRTGSWEVIHVLVAVGALAAAAGVAGLVAVHGDRFEPHAGVVVGGTAVGAAVTAAIMLTEAFAFPVLAARTPELLELDGPLLGSLGVRATVVVAGLYPVGVLVAGVLAARSDVAPLAGRSLAASTVAFLVLGGPFVPVLGILATVWFAASHLWWGVVLWRADLPRGAAGRSLVVAGTS